MDPINLIFTAISAIAANGGRSEVSNAALDAYSELKTLIHRKTINMPHAKLALEEFERDPETWKSAMRELLVEFHLDQSEEIIQASRRVLSLVPLPHTPQSKYMIQLNNVQGYAQGDYQQVKLFFKKKLPDIDTAKQS
jgi:hypothetical protein